MNRTPRSARRRARRQLAANGAGLARVGSVQLEGGCGSLEISASSGTDVCIRNAISYWAMRAEISGSLILFNFISLSFARSSSIRRRASRRIPGGFDRYSTGIGAGAELHALVLGGQKPAAPQRDRRAPGRVSPMPCETITTNAGRSLFSLPRP